MNSENRKKMIMLSVILTVINCLGFISFLKGPREVRLTFALMAAFNLFNTFFLKHLDGKLVKIEEEKQKKKVKVEDLYPKD